CSERTNPLGWLDSRWVARACTHARAGAVRARRTGMRTCPCHPGLYVPSGVGTEGMAGAASRRLAERTPCSLRNEPTAPWPNEPIAPLRNGPCRDTNAPRRTNPLLQEE